MSDINPLHFDEDGYQRLYPDVAEALQKGEVASGHLHYQNCGKSEGRLFVGRIGPFARVTIGPDEGPPRVNARAVPSHSIDAVFMSEGGGLFIVGWFDDTADRLTSLRVECCGWTLTIEADALSRVGRDDVQAALGVQGRRDFGFWVLLYSGQHLPTAAECEFVFIWQSGREGSHQEVIRRMDRRELRDAVLGFFAEAAHGSNPQLSAMASLDRFAGEQILSLNRAVTRGVVAAPYVERFGPSERSFKGSIVVCLYGKPEYMFLQNALFSGKPGIEDYEWIYVCNSPELVERLLKEARIGALIHGVSQTVVALAGNAGFGAANNVAVNYASSDRILIVNPDVFPKEADWAARHTELVALHPDRSKLFGGPLYYDDGSLMHGGMYFEIDIGISVAPSGIVPRRLVRVEHYGKGAPPDTAEFIRPRPVPAVSGAFISCDRQWYEKLGGFSEDYVFGHYEDADFCLKSIEAGVLPWLHDLKLYHLEGRGSVRRPLHEGGSMVNRWLFSNTWSERIAADLLGPKPQLRAGAAKPRNPEPIEQPTLVAETAE